MYNHYVILSGPHNSLECFIVFQNREDGVRYAEEKLNMEVIDDGSEWEPGKVYVTSVKVYATVVQIK